MYFRDLSAIDRTERKKENNKLRMRELRKQKKEATPDVSKAKPVDEKSEETAEQYASRLAKQKERQQKLRDAETPKHKLERL